MKPTSPEIIPFILGMMENNSYLLFDPQSMKGVVIDPSYDSDRMLRVAHRKGIDLQMVLLTHAHFDHIAGVRDCCDAANPPLRIALHPDDLELYHQRGGAALFGMPMAEAPTPQVLLENEQVLRVGNIELIVYHAPGHTPGHVIFYCPAAKAAFCGDVIFAGSIGRTDLPGGDFDQLMVSIQSTILTLPPDTRLLSGHGPATTVAEEAANNPFLRGL